MATVGVKGLKLHEELQVTVGLYAPVTVKRIKMECAKINALFTVKALIFIKITVLKLFFESP